jgi:hypothetical protein
MAWRKFSWPSISTRAGDAIHHSFINLVVSVFILVQLNVQYSMLLKGLFTQHVSAVTASIVRSTTVVFHNHRFFCGR